jgi:hypothetical protein
LSFGVEHDLSMMKPTTAVDFLFLRLGSREFSHAPLVPSSRYFRRPCKSTHRRTTRLRRTAVRNLEIAGVPRTAAMKMVCHKTESIYRRYAIVYEAMMQSAAEKLGALHKQQSKVKAHAKVVRMKTEERATR